MWSRILIITALLTHNGITSLKILGIFPCNMPSHLTIGQQLMKELNRRGHKVDVISSSPQKQPLPNYRDIVVQPAKQLRFLNNVTFAATKAARTANVGDYVRDYGVDVCESLSHPNMQEVMKKPKGHYDVLVIEIAIWPCYLALGEHLNAPIVGISPSKLPDWLWRSFGNSLNPSYIPSIMSLAGQQMTFWERLKNTVTTTALTCLINYHVEAERRQVELYFGRKLSSVQQLYDDVSLVLVNSHHSINEIRPFTPDIIEVGGLHVVGDEQQLTPDLQKWLDESTEGCVYFSFGSMVKIESFPLDIVKVFYEAFRRIAPMRVLMKTAELNALPEGLPKNTKTAPWLPQIAVLKHKNVKLFVTHGGLLGIQEAIVHKVPMIGFPLFGDQYPNVQSCAMKKIAIAMSLDETLTADALVNSITTVLTDPTYRINMEKISDIFLDRLMNPLDTAVYWVEYTARHGKALKSPATKLPWWQLYLLDVYGFILCGVLLCLYAVIKVVGISMRYLRAGSTAEKSSIKTRNTKKSRKSFN